MADHIFQEKHTTGWLPWKKITYYKYFKYADGSLFQLSIFSEQTIKAVEGGK